MDLPQVEAYLRPASLDTVAGWQPGWFWLAGGTWIFSEPEPAARVLVDLEPLNWSEIEVTEAGLTIGATCTLAAIARHAFPPEWTATHALQCAANELGSFKIANVATVGGNLCLAIPPSTFAPVMVLLGATYELWNPDGTVRQVPAREFQTGAKQTLLQPGEALRKIWIPAENLNWRVSFQRMCVATAGAAIAIVATAYNPSTQAVRFAIGACLPAPRLLEFPTPPSAAEIATALQTQLPVEWLINSPVASAAYRHEMTQVMMARSLQEAMKG